MNVSRSNIEHQNYSTLITAPDLALFSVITNCFEHAQLGMIWALFGVNVPNIVIVYISNSKPTNMDT